MNGASAAVPEGLTVLKLGGSYAFSPHLPSILDAVCGARAALVVVPGGGPFADRVREAQPVMAFSERAAHRMAFLAMAQFAEALAALAPALRVAAGLDEIKAALSRSDVPVWSPWPLTDGLQILPEGWNLTSDSLAAWLAGRLGAARLVLLKHRDPPVSPMTLHEAAQAGIVDPLFPGFATAFLRPLAPSPGGLAAALSLVGKSRARKRPNEGTSQEKQPSKNGSHPRRSGAAVWWVGPAQLDTLAAVIEGGGEAGLRLHVNENALRA